MTFAPSLRIYAFTKDVYRSINSVVCHHLKCIVTCSVWRYSYLVHCPISSYWRQHCAYKLLRLCNENSRHLTLNNGQVSPFTSQSSILTPLPPPCTNKATHRLRQYFTGPLIRNTVRNKEAAFWTGQWAYGGARSERRATIRPNSKKKRRTRHIPAGYYTKKINDTVLVDGSARCLHSLAVSPGPSRRSEWRWNRWNKEERDDSIAQWCWRRQQWMP